MARWRCRGMFATGGGENISIGNPWGDYRQGGAGPAPGSVERRIQEGTGRLLSGVGHFLLSIVRPWA